jgi:hypothetical protein
MELLDGGTASYWDTFLTRPKNHRRHRNEPLLLETFIMSDIEYHTYPTKALIRPIGAFAVLVSLILFAVIRLETSGRADLAFDVLIVAVLGAILPTIALALAWSSIGVSDNEVRARVFGVVWKRIPWSEVSVIQRVVFQGRSAESMQLQKCRLLIGRGHSTNFRIAFSSSIKDFDKIVAQINRISSTHRINIYSVAAASNHNRYYEIGEKLTQL